MRLELTLLATQDLRNLHRYGVGEYGATAADDYLAELFATFEVIAQWPYAVRERLAVRPPVRLRPHRAHNILYSVIDETAVVLRVLHHTANWVDLV